MKRDRNPNPNRWPRYAAAAGVAVLVGAGLVVADTLTRPLDVHLQTRIDIYQEDLRGEWEKIDQVGPVNVRFDANLLEMARGSKIGTGFELHETSQAGEEYAVRLAQDAAVDVNPASGRFDANVVFVVTYAGKSARVLAEPTTETRFGPAGAMRGRRADGVLGRGSTTLTLVSVNELRLEGERPMMLVTEETYRMIPTKGGRQGS